METPNAFAASPMATIVSILEIIALVWSDVKRTVPTLAVREGRRLAGLVEASA
jgi:hypothetical protein